MAGKLKTCTGQNILQLTIKLHINYFYKCHLWHCFTSTHRQIVPPATAVVTLGRSLHQICELSLVLYFPHSSGNSCFPVPQISCARLATLHGSTQPYLHQQHTTSPTLPALLISLHCSNSAPHSSPANASHLQSPISSHPEPRDLIHFTVFYKKNNLKLFPRPPPVDLTKP